MRKMEKTAQLERSSSSFASAECKECGEVLPARALDEQINHYISSHGYELVHVGESTSRNPDDGKPWHDVIAIVGKPI